ncbi:hypothetical protein NL676_010340 [Syzygium grande]|nr:hypothetical protein NL676_010340 [Syzygium grande]
MATAPPPPAPPPLPSGDSPPPPPPPDDREPQSRPPALGSRSCRAIGGCSAPALDKPQKQASGCRGEREAFKINIAGTDHRSGGGGGNISKGSGGDGDNEEAEAEEAVQRPWNLRPRRGASNGSSRNGEPREAFPTVNPSVQQEERKENANQPPKSARLRGFAEAASGERKEEAEEGKRRLWARSETEEATPECAETARQRFPRSLVGGNHGRCLPNARFTGEEMTYAGLAVSCFQGGFLRSRR